MLHLSEGLCACLIKMFHASSNSNLKARCLILILHNLTRCAAPSVYFSTSCEHCFKHPLKEAFWRFNWFSTPVRVLKAFLSFSHSRANKSCIQKAFGGMKERKCTIVDLNISLIALQGWIPTNQKVAGTESIRRKNQFLKISLFWCLYTNLKPSLLLLDCSF